MATSNKRKIGCAAHGEQEEENVEEPVQKRTKSTGKRMSTRRQGLLNRIDKQQQLPVRRIIDEIIQEEKAAEAEAEARSCTRTDPNLVEVSESEPEEETAMERGGGEITLEAMKQLLNDQLKNVATREDIDSIKAKISANAEDIAQLRGVVGRLERDVDRRSETTNECLAYDVSRLVDEKLEGRPMNPGGQNPTREEAYLRARRSARIWPIEGSNEASMRLNLETFLVEALNMTKGEVDDLDIEEVTRTRLRHNTKIHLEILVRFSSIEARDSVAMCGGQLAEYIDENRRPLAGIRIDIPIFLTGTFKLLTNYGYKLRKLHGEGTKRYIKFDEANLSLYLDVKLPDCEEWFQITPTQAKELQEQGNRTYFKRLQSTLGLDSGASSGASTTSESSNLHAFPIRLMSLSQSRDDMGGLGQSQAHRGSKWKPAARKQ